MQKEYWVCMIGPIDRSKVPYGDDFPLRRAVQDAIDNLVGEDEEVCYSGWGYSAEQIDAMRKAAYPQGAS